MNKILKISSIILILALFAFSCKHDQGGQNDGAKSLVLSSFKIGDSVYDKENNRISVTKQTVTFEDIDNIVFTDEGGTTVQGVNWKMEPDRFRIGKTNEAKFQIVVSTPPSGYKPYKSGEITAIRELIPPRVTEIMCHGVRADLSKTPYTVRIPRPTVTKPMTTPQGEHYGDISIQFDKDVPEMAVSWEGLPGVDGKPALKPEDVAHVTIKVPEKAGLYKAGEYKLDITFETPSLHIDSVSIIDQDGDTDLKKLRVNVKNSKTEIKASDVTITFRGEYIEGAELSAIQPTYEGLPLTNLEVSTPKSFKVKVAAKQKAYRDFEATITVVRANVPLVLEKISVFGEDKDINSPFTHTVDTMTTFVKKGDIKATFKKPDNTKLTVDCLLKGSEEDKVYLKAGVKNIITFYVPQDDAYAEYRNQVEIMHDAEWEKMIELPMQAGGVTFKSGLKDENDKTINRKFEVGQFPVTYKLFNDVCDWALTGAGKNKGYTNIDKLKASGQNGSIRKPKEEFGSGHPDGSGMMPVSSITPHGALVWCNMYSEMKGFAPAYYKPEKGKIDVDWHYPTTGADYNLYTTFTPTITVNATLSKDDINALALRDAIENHDYHSYTNAQWEKIRDMYIKVAVLTAKQAKFGDETKSGYRLIDTEEWEFASRLRKTMSKHCTSSTLVHGGITYYFGNKDTAAGSNGYGTEGSEIEKVAWILANSVIDGELQTHPIGEKIPTDLGFYDLAGNVASWTNTWSKQNGSSNEAKVDYTVYAVGGAFCDEAHRCVVSSNNPAFCGRYDQYGIRLSRTLE